MNSRPRPLTGILAALSAGALGLLAPRVAFAVDVFPSLSDWIIGSFYSAITWVIYVIGYLLTVIPTLIFALEAFALTFVLKLNFEIINSPIVQIGFSVILAFALIILVAALILMAVSTIVRYVPYGVKRMFFKIVIAAIGINFSLVLIGTVMNFSDQISVFFINSSIPSVNAPSGQGPGVHEFTQQLAGAFQPQRSLTIGSSASTTMTSVVAEAGGGIYAAILGVFASAFTSIAMAVFLGVLVGAFAIRYLWLGILCMLVPAAVVAWVFGHPYARKWMNSFIKWTFFGPITLFFLYLSMKIAEALNSSRYLSQESVSAELGSPGVGQELQKYLGIAAGPLINTTLKAFIVNGALWAGLMIASSMGIGVAGSGMKAIESMGNVVKRNTVDRVGRSAKNKGVRTLDRVRGAGKDQFGNSAVQRLGSRIAVLGSGSRVGNVITSATGIKAAGRAIANVGNVDKKGPEERAKDYKEQYKSLTPPELRKRLDRMMTGSLGSLGTNGDEERAILELLGEKKSLGGLSDIKNSKGEKYANTKDEDAHKERLRKLMIRARDGGYAETILKNNPVMARYAPAKKLTPDKDSRNMTQAEMVGAAFKSVDKEGAKAIISVPDLFGPKLEPGQRYEDHVTAEHVHAVTSLKGSVLTDMLQDGDPEAVSRWLQTRDFIKAEFEKTQREKEEFEKTDHPAGQQAPISSKLFRPVARNKEKEEYSDDTDGYGLTDGQMQALKVKERIIDKSPQVSAHVDNDAASADENAPAGGGADAAKKGEKKEDKGKKEGDSSTDATKKSLSKRRQKRKEGKERRREKAARRGQQQGGRPGQQPRASRRPPPPINTLRP